MCFMIEMPADPDRPRPFTIPGWPRVRVTWTVSTEPNCRGLVLVETNNDMWRWRAEELVHNHLIASGLAVRNNPQFAEPEGDIVPVSWGEVTATEE